MVASAAGQPLGNPSSLQGRREGGTAGCHVPASSPHPPVVTHTHTHIVMSVFACMTNIFAFNQIATRKLGMFKTGVHAHTCGSFQAGLDDIWASTFLNNKSSLSNFLLHTYDNNFVT